MTIGEKIRNFRVDHKLTVKDLAENIGYSSSAVSSWEAGTNAPGVFAAKDLCDYMGITVDELLKGVDSR